MKEAIERLKILSQDKNLRMIEEVEERIIRNIRAETAYSIDKGIQQGIQEGLQQDVRKIIQEIALNALKQNINISIISKITGLLESEINKLKKRL